MTNEFELDNMIQQYLDERCTENGTMNSESIKGLIVEIVRMIQYDASFEKKLLKNTTDYIEQNYPRIKFWEENVGSFPDILTVTEEQFREQRALLRKNFSHERVEWMEKAGKKLYGKKNEGNTILGESQKQKERKTSAPNTSPKTAGMGMLLMIIIVLLGILKFVMTD